MECFRPSRLRTGPGHPGSVPLFYHMGAGFCIIKFYTAPIWERNRLTALPAGAARRKRLPGPGPPPPARCRREAPAMARTRERPRPAPPQLPGAGLVQARKKGSKVFLQKFRWDSHALITDLHPGACARTHGPDGHGPAGAVVFDGVFHEIEEGALQQDGVSRYGHGPVYSSRMAMFCARAASSRVPAARASSRERSTRSLHSNRPGWRGTEVTELAGVESRSVCSSRTSRSAAVSGVPPEAPSSERGTCGS